MQVVFVALATGLLTGALVGLAHFVSHRRVGRPPPGWVIGLATVLSLQGGRLLIDSPVYAHFQDLVDPSGRAKRLFTRQAEVALEEAPIAALFKGKSSVEAYAIGRQLSTNGLHRLPAANLSHWHSIRKKLVDQSESFCAALWTGKLNEDEMFALLGRLPEEDQRVFAESTSSAIRLGLQPIDPAVVNEDAQGDLFLSVAESLEGTDGERFKENLGNYAGLTTPENCWMIQRMFIYLDSLQGDEKEQKLRIFASIGAQNL